MTSQSHQQFINRSSLTHQQRQQNPNAMGNQARYTPTVTRFKQTTIIHGSYIGRKATIVKEPF